MLLRRHTMLAMLSASLLTGATLGLLAGAAQAEVLTVPGAPMPPSPLLAGVTPNGQKTKPDAGVTAAAPPAALSAASIPIAEAPPVQTPSLPPEAEAATGDRPTFQFLPLLPSASDTDSAPALWPILSSQNLASSHVNITRAVIVIHDADRDAATGLNRMRKLVGSVASGPEARTIIFAPLFPTEAERPAFKTALGDAARNLAVWGSDAWAYGGETQVKESQQSVSSMLALDVLLLYLADRQSFPSLRTIVVAGAGSGGDFVQRYALYGRAPDIIAEQKLTPRFVVAAAQSYAYLTEVRPKAGAEGFAPPSDKAQQECPSYQDYPYGLDAPNHYSQQTAASTAKQNYPTRDVVYLYGAQDTTAAHDQSCAAKLQGSSVKARAVSYDHYLHTLFSENLAQHFVALPGLGGSADKIWGSNCGLSVLFADGECIKD
jgi:hypothetical protein